MLLVLFGTWFSLREEPLDTRFSGAYRLSDGRLVTIAARSGSSLRYRLLDGRSGALRPVGEGVYEAGPGWSGSEPVEVSVAFEGDGEQLTWRSKGDQLAGQRVALPEIDAHFQSGEIELRARLVLPEGEGPFPAAVIVHGSGSESAIDTYADPYRMAPHGFATLVFDKRGTGGSDGSYTQNFHLLAADVRAAVEWLKTRSEIEPGNIHLVGYSQGGWVAPLAATQVEVASLLINYGPMVPVIDEDRWGYVDALQNAGFGADAIREVDTIAEIAGRIVDHRENRWAELDSALEAAREAEWFDTVRGSDSIVGFIAGTRMPMWVVRLYSWWQFRGDEPFVDRLYDPVPTAKSLDIPSLWIFGELDSSMPTEWSIDALGSLRAEGRPIEIEVFPGAEHGIVLFEDRGDERVYLGYAPGYFETQLEWLRQQSRLAGADFSLLQP